MYGSSVDRDLYCLSLVLLYLGRNNFLQVYGGSAFCSVSRAQASLRGVVDPISFYRPEPCGKGLPIRIFLSHGYRYFSTFQVLVVGCLQAFCSKVVMTILISAREGRQFVFPSLFGAVLRVLYFRVFYAVFVGAFVFFPNRCCNGTFFFRSHF